MPRLFVAIDLPRVVTKRLSRSQPPPLPGIRLTPAEQMHITLHFIGEAELAPILKGLGSIEHALFTLSIEHIGYFKTVGGGFIIWAGLQPSDELSSLHAAVGKRLNELGLKTESRAYKPHVTLARCRPAARSMLSDFMATHESVLIPSIPVVAFSLYSSDLSGGSPVYKREGRYSLKA
ncbi:MAG TPA: RNA 2',3'-cyclic phosphodiesterase [Methylophilaceae bacterium]|nr:RNA 2',3'-cyclic phosphodiesterase [Methylophilaceae bacterium]